MALYNLHQRKGKSLGGGEETQIEEWGGQGRGAVVVLLVAEEEGVCIGMAIGPGWLANPSSLACFNMDPTQARPTPHACGPISPSWILILWSVTQTQISPYLSWKRLGPKKSELTRKLAWTDLARGPTENKKNPTIGGFIPYFATVAARLILTV